MRHPRLHRLKRRRIHQRRQRPRKLPRPPHLRPDADTRYFVGALAVAVGALQISGQVHISSHKLRQITRSNLLLGSLQIIFGLCLIFLPTSLVTLWAARLWMLATVAVMYWNAYRLRRLWQVMKASPDQDTSPD